MAGSAHVDSTSNNQGGTIVGSAGGGDTADGRGPTKLLGIVPGIAADPSSINDSPGSFGLFSANGNRGRSNNYLLDGTDMNDGYRNLPAINEAGVFGTPATILPVESIAEVAVLSNFESEYGRNSGAIVNIVTHSGTTMSTARFSSSFGNSALERAITSTPSRIRGTTFREPPVRRPLSEGRSFAGPDVLVFQLRGPAGARRASPGALRVPDPRDLRPRPRRMGAPTTRSSPACWRAILAGAQPPGGAVFDPSPTSSCHDPCAERRRQPDREDRPSLLGASSQVTGDTFRATARPVVPAGDLAGSVLPGYNTVTPTRVHLVSCRGSTSFRRRESTERASATTGTSSISFPRIRTSIRGPSA